MNQISIAKDATRKRKGNIILIRTRKYIVLNIFYFILSGRNKIKKNDSQLIANYENNLIEKAKNNIFDKMLAVEILDYSTQDNSTL